MLKKTTLQITAYHRYTCKLFPGKPHEGSLKANKEIVGNKIGSGWIVVLNE